MGRVFPNRTWGSSLVVFALQFVACSTAAGGGTNGGVSSTDVTVWTAWGGQELKAFESVLKPFHNQTGINVHLSTVRDVSQLAINVVAGTALPDIASVPTTIDKLQSWVSKGVMKPVETALGDQFQAYMQNTVPSLTTDPTGATTNLQIGLVNGKHYRLFIKTQVVGFFRYDPKAHSGPAPATWNDRVAIDPSKYDAITSGSVNG